MNKDNTNKYISMERGNLTGPQLQTKNYRQLKTALPQVRSPLTTN